MTIQHLYPTTRPSLDLNFARQKRLDPRVTFTRGSTATYVGSDGLIKTAASNEARFDHDPVTGESLGLLNEWSRTNLVTYSQDFTNSYWFGNSNVTANTDVAPDGNLTASTYSSTGSQLQSNFIPITSNTNYTGSIYIKKTTGRTYTAGLLLNYDGGVPYGILLNTNDGTTSSAGYTLPTVAVSSVGNFWRISLTANSGSTVNVRILVYPNMNSNAAVATGQQVIWGAQLEASSAGSSTSYIPTSGATATRAAEVTTITGTNFSSWYNQTEGTFILDERNSYSSYSQDVRFELNQNSSPTTNALCFAVNYNAGTRITCRDANTSGTIDRTLANVWTLGGSHKFAYGIEENNISVVAGTNVATDTSCTLPSNLDSLSIGGQGRTVTNVNPVGRVNIARLTYYPTRLTDAQLQALTL